jgi:hypothetical protein
VNVSSLTLARAITLQTVQAASKYLDVPGVTRSVDLGADENLLRSVFIDVETEPTSDDTTFVRSVGAQGEIGVLSPVTIAAVMPLSVIGELDQNPRFLAVTVGLDDNVPQQ